MRTARAAVVTTLLEHMAAGTLIRAMAAHSPLSALLAEEAGFEAVWASGFELSALYGLPDASLVSMSEHLAMVRAMSARVALPIVADIDTGYGNAVNVIHAVREYERAGAAAVVIEDKHFPKATSLRDGARHPLVDTDEFCGKIEAGLYARRRRDFLVIARTEALIAGLSVDAALTRARAYADAGADMVLVHSRQRTPVEIEAFVAAWDRRAPIVVVPTTYPRLTEARARQLGGIGMVIYGNHAIRASVKAMRAAFAEIARCGAALSAAESIATVEEIFALQGSARLDDEERRFLR
jgi:phosphoenolpyruvate phosphomutase